MLKKFLPKDKQQTKLLAGGVAAFLTITGLFMMIRRRRNTRIATEQEEALKKKQEQENAAENIGGLVLKCKEKVKNESSSSSADGAGVGVGEEKFLCWGHRSINWFPNVTALTISTRSSNFAALALVHELVHEEKYEISQFYKNAVIIDGQQLFKSLLTNRHNKFVEYDLSSLTKTAEEGNMGMGLFSNSYQVNCTSVENMIGSLNIGAKHGTSASSPTTENASSAGVGKTLLISHLYFDCESCSLVELIFARDEILETKQLIASSLVAKPNVEATAKLVTNIPSSAVRVTVPAKHWYIERQHLIFKDLKTRIQLDSKNVKEEVEELLKSKSLSASSDSSSSSSKQQKEEEIELVTMTSDQVIATPAASTVLIHDKIGVEFCVLPEYEICEPRFASTNTIGCILHDVKSEISSSSSSATTTATKEKNKNQIQPPIVSFEVWSDVPEKWFHKQKNQNNSENQSTTTEETKEEFEDVDRHFLEGCQFLVLGGLTNNNNDNKSPHVGEACGVKDAGIFEGENQGRKVRVLVFRRQEKNQIVICKLEGDSENWNTSVQASFRRLLDSCVVFSNTEKK